LHILLVIAYFFGKVSFLFYTTCPIQKNCLNENCFNNSCVISIQNLIINDFILLPYILASLKVLKYFQAFNVLAIEHAHVSYHIMKEKVFIMHQ